MPKLILAHRSNSWNELGETAFINNIWKLLGIQKTTHTHVPSLSPDLYSTYANKLARYERKFSPLFPSPPQSAATYKCTHEVITDFHPGEEILISTDDVSYHLKHLKNKAFGLDGMPNHARNYYLPKRFKSSPTFTMLLSV